MNQIKDISHFNSKNFKLALFEHIQQLTSIFYHSKNLNIPENLTLSICSGNELEQAKSENKFKTISNNDFIAFINIIEENISINDILKEKNQFIIIETDMNFSELIIWQNDFYYIISTSSIKQVLLMENISNSNYKIINYIN